MVHHRALEKMYVNAGVNVFFRPAIHIEEGTATVRMTVRPEMHHAAHAAHGVVYFKMLDDAAFFAVQSLVPDVFVLTASFTLYFLAPVQDGELVATGRVVHQTKRLFIAEAIVESDGRVIGRGSGTFMRSATRLDAAVGYVPQ